MYKILYYRIKLQDIKPEDMGVRLGRATGEGVKPQLYVSE